MTTAFQNRATREADVALHRLLQDKKDARSLGSNQRIEPEEFFPVEPRRLIELAGWTISSVATVGYTTAGEPLAAKCTGDEKTIWILRTLSPEAARYTLAHELGHVLMHTEIPDCDAGRRPRVLSMLGASKRKNSLQYSETEREAEIFARELLMPERAVRRHFRELFALDQLRAGSALVSSFANLPRSSEMDLRLVARELSQFDRRSSMHSLCKFFGVSTAAIASRLVGLHLVY
jgi:Zn-dependent peptidase ImmA (M78 family)